MVETTAVVLGVLVSFVIAIGVRFLANRVTFPYTVLLVTVGFTLTIFPLQTYLGFSLDPLFTRDTILFIFLPAILFYGAAEIDHELFRRNLPIIVITVIVGLPVAILAIGWLGAKLFGIPLLIMLLFGAMAYPIDPVAVLSLFKEAGAPPRLAVLVEGESLLDDGLAIVLFSAVLALVEEASPTELSGTELLSLDRLWPFLINFHLVSLGGILVGVGIGYATYLTQRAVNDKTNLFMISVVGVYGGFFLAEQVLHVSGILATVATGITLGTLSRRSAVSEEHLEFLGGIWERLVFLSETMLFVAIGIEVSSIEVLRTLPIVLTTLLLLIGVRAGVIYGIMNLLNQVIEDPVPIRYQHVIIWGGMHGVIPIALALGLGPSVPFGEQLKTAVFGVVVASMIIQGLLMTSVLEATGVT
jgi:CPA1 family monovalent cation:H+ antiporter